MGRMHTYIRKVAYGQRYPLSSVVRPCTTLDNEFDKMSNSLLHRTTSIRGRYKAEAVFDERRSTARIKQQKDTSGKRGNIKPVRPCTGLIARFANSKTCF